MEKRENCLNVKKSIIFGFMIQGKSLYCRDFCKICNMNTFTFCRDKRCHSRIPFPSPMIKMNSYFQHLFQIDVPISSFLFFSTLALS